MNKEGANIQYPYHELPMKTSHDRLGFWALFGIYEGIVDEMDVDGMPNGNKKEIDCGSRREDEK